MPYIGNVLTSFAVETGNINDQAVTAPKLSATGGTNGQVLALDSNLNLEWVSDPAGQWVTSGSNIYYNDGNVGIGTASPDKLLHLSGADTAIIRLENSDTSLAADQIIGGLEFEKRDTSGAGAGVVGGLRMYSKGASGESVYLTLSTSGSSDNDVERVRIDASGRLLVGTSNTRNVAGGVNAKLQVEGTATGSNTTAVSVTQNSDNTTAPTLSLTKSRATAVGGVTIVEDNDPLGRINFSGADGTDANSTGARIEAAVDGTPGSNDMPGRLVFSTTADAASSPTERMRIDSSGRLLVGTTSAVDTSDEAIVHIVDTLGARLVLGRNDTTVVDGNGLGGIRFAGNDTTSNTFTTLGEILCQADGTHAAGDNPTRLTFKTTADGSSSATEHLRIASSGYVGIGETAPEVKLHVNGGSDNTVVKIESSDAGARIHLTDNHATSSIEQNSNELILNSDINSVDGSSAITFKVDNSEGARLDSSGRLMIGTTTTGPSTADDLTIATTGNTGISIRSGTSSSGNIFFSDGTSGGDQTRGVIQYDHSSNYMRLYTDNAERLRIDASGRLLLGATSSVAPNRSFQIAGSANMSICANVNSADGVTVDYIKSRNTTYGSNTIVQDDDTIAKIQFRADDGGDYLTQAAQIAAQVDGTPGANDMPGRLVFYTTADGANSPTERLRIDSSGNVGIGNTSPAVDLHIQKSGAAEIAVGSTDAGGAAIFLDGDANGDVSGGDYAFLQHDTSGDLNVANLKSGNILFKGTSSTERMRIDSSGQVGIGTTSPVTDLELSRTGNNADGLTLTCSDHTNSPRLFFESTSTDGAPVLFSEDGDLRINTGGTPGSSSGTERMRLDSDGRLTIGTTGQLSAPISQHLGVATTTGTGISNLRFGNNGSPPYLQLGKSRGTSVGNYTSVNSGDEVGRILFVAADGTDMQCQPGSIACFIDGTPGSNDMPGRLVFRTTADGSESPTERMRITNSGAVLVGKTATTFTLQGTGLFSDGSADFVRNNDPILYINRQNSDGGLVNFYQAANLEGSISVSGSTVSYNGGHIARWSQLASGAERTEILRGSVLSNLDEMCEWGEEDNEQLNRMKISDVEGDVNVSGVFQAWDDDDDTYTNDFYCAMTGDFVIRIAQGTTVARGDLLMSAGDGTAKPQDDDIVRSKTIAKVTSTTVSTTYADGSYCVPCVLMAC